MENREKVLNTMLSSAKPLKTGEIAELAGIDKKEAEKAIKQLSTEGKVFSPVRCYWQSK